MFCKIKHSLSSKSFECDVIISSTWYALQQRFLNKPNVFKITNVFEQSKNFKILINPSVFIISVLMLSSHWYAKFIKAHTQFNCNAESSWSDKFEIFSIIPELSNGILAGENSRRRLQSVAVTKLRDSTDLSLSRIRRSGFQIAWSWKYKIILLLTIKCLNQLELMIT